MVPGETFTAADTQEFTHLPHTLLADFREQRTDCKEIKCVLSFKCSTSKCMFTSVFKAIIIHFNAFLLHNLRLCRLSLMKLLTE